MTYDVAKALPSNMFTKAGWAFMGWTTNGNVNVVYSDGALVRNLTVEQNATVLVQSVWTSLAVTNVVVAWGVNSVQVTWDAVQGVTGYRIWRNGSQIGTTTETRWTDNQTTLHHSAYSYQIQSVHGDVAGELSQSASKEVDLMPLRNVLHVMDRVTGDVDGYISDTEMLVALHDSGVGDLDGTPREITSAERSVFTRIQTLNNDKELIHRVIQGDYTYGPMTYSVMYELQDLSDTIKELTKNRNN